MKPRAPLGLPFSIAAWLLLAALSWFVYERGIPRVERHVSQVTDSSRAALSVFETTSGQRVYGASLADKETLAHGVTAPGRDVLANLALLGDPTQLCSAVIELRDSSDRLVAESGTAQRCARTSEQLRVTHSTATKDGERTIELHIPDNTAEGMVLSAKISILFYKSELVGSIMRGGLTERAVYGARDPLVEQTLYNPAGITVAKQSVLVATPEYQWRKRIRAVALQHLAVAVLALILFGIVPSLLGAESEDARVLIPLGLAFLVNSLFLSLYLIQIVLNMRAGFMPPLLVATGVIAYVNLAVTVQLQTNSLNFAQSLKSRFT